MRHNWLCLGFAAWAAGSAAQAQTYVTPMMGGGQVAADMTHIDIFYDETANQLTATIDDSGGEPVLRSLGAGYEFDPAQPYAVLNGKAYNSQYGWNAGGQFSIPAGAGIWIELINCSPGLETYSGNGRLASYAPLFGTSGSAFLWKWSGVMAHNTYALQSASIPFQFASYHIYFGDSQTGARGAYSNYADTFVTLRWTTDLQVPPVMMFGAEDLTNHSTLTFLNASEFDTNSGAVMNLRYTNGGPYALSYASPFRTMAVPATALNGGPYANHALEGSMLVLELVSVTGPAQSQLSFWEKGEFQPVCTMVTGGSPGTNVLKLSETRRHPDSDPYGAVQGRYISANKPGLYCLAFRVVDIFSAGTGGAPIHSPSPLHHLYLQAGFTIASLGRQENTASVTFGGEPGRSFYLERSASPGKADSWQTVAGPLTGTNRLQALTDSTAPTGTAFFRLRVE